MGCRYASRSRNWVDAPSYARTIFSVSSTLKKPLQELEFADEVFAEAKKLEDVVIKIEAKSLAVDHKLAVSAKLWRDWAPNNVIQAIKAMLDAQRRALGLRVSHAARGHAGRYPARGRDRGLLAVF